MSLRAEVDREKEWLTERYGALIELPVAAKLLGFRSPSALRQAAQRGTAPVRVVQAQPRRRLVVLADEVAEYLVRLRREAEQSSRRESASVTARRGGRRVEVRV